jgi:catechol 2,3-dioxygenase-like lactoylglutathione lyase family enzyme
MEEGMFDHIGFSTPDVTRSRAFYEKALAPLGIRCLMEVTPEMTGDGSTHLGFGKERPQFWIGTGPRHQPGIHVAFAAESRALVDAFHAAAIAAGGRDNGPPGIRAHYHPDYYGAFVLDPDGHNIEAVCHKPAAG